MLTDQDEPDTFAQAVRQYLQRYPESSPKQAALAACRRLHLPTSGPQFHKKLNETRQIKYRLNKAKRNVNIVRSDGSHVIKGVGNGGVEFDVHRVVFSGTMPSWLIASVTRAAQREFAGWRVANDRTGLLVCEFERLGFSPYRIVAYRCSGFMTLYPGRRSYNYDELKYVSWSNLVHVLNEMGPEDQRQFGERYQVELREFWDGVFARVGSHVAFKVRGMKNATPFKIRVKSRGLNVRHDGSDPDCIELEVDPQGADLRGVIKKSQEVACEVRELRAAVRDSNVAMKEMNGCVRKIAEGLRDFATFVQFVASGKGVDSLRARRDPDWSIFN
jgi:hypothetical protein